MQTLTIMNTNYVTSGTILTLLILTIARIVFMMYKLKSPCNSLCACCISKFMTYFIKTSVIEYNLTKFADFILYRINIYYYLKLDSVCNFSKGNQTVKINITNMVYLYLYDNIYIRYENELWILDFPGYSSMIIKTFHTDCISVSMQNSIVNSLFGKYSLYAISELTVIRITFKIDSVKFDVNINDTADLTHIKLCNNTFNNCYNPIKMWTLTVKRYSEMNKNNCNLAISLSIINNTFLCGSVLNVIFGIEIKLPNNLCYHDNVFNDISLNRGNEYLIYLHMQDNELKMYLDETVWNDNIGISWIIIINDPTRTIDNKANIGINQQFANVTDVLSIESNKLQFETVQNIIGMERTDNAVLFRITDCPIINSNEIMGFNGVYVQNIQSTNREIIERLFFTSHSVVEIILRKSNITNNDPSIKGDVTIASDAEIKERKEYFLHKNWFANVYSFLIW